MAWVQHPKSGEWGKWCRNNRTGKPYFKRRVLFEMEAQLSAHGFTRGKLKELRETIEACCKYCGMESGEHRPGCKEDRVKRKKDGDSLA